MRLAVLVVALFLLEGVLACAGVHAQDHDSCLDKETQREMNLCETERYRKADADLNHVFQEVLAKRAAHRGFIEKLRIAEDAWIKFRDAHIESLYSEKDKSFAYGSVFQMCKALELTSLTNARAEFLKTILSPADGDVCGFSLVNLSPGKDGIRSKPSLFSTAQQSRVGCRKPVSTIE